MSVLFSIYLMSFDDNKFSKPPGDINHLYWPFLIDFQESRCSEAQRTCKFASEHKTDRKSSLLYNFLVYLSIKSYLEIICENENDPSSTGTQDV